MQPTPRRWNHSTLPSGRDESKPERVAAYVDGYNFYHGLMAKRWGRFRWLDYSASWGGRSCQIRNLSGFGTSPPRPRISRTNR